MASNTGRAFSSAAASPPMKNVSVPSAAPFCPPETGASRKWRPFSESRAAIDRAESAAIVEESITMAPRVAPAAVPGARERLGFPGSSRREGKRKTRLRQISGHALAHRAESDEGDSKNAR